MKCPCCGKEAEFRISCNGNDSYWFCPDCFISSSSKPWENLTKTKQALDIAVDTLKYANKCIKGGCVDWRTEIDKALDQIKQITETKGDNNE